MIRSTRTLAGLLLSLIVGLSACTDHLNVPGQARLRLRRTISTSPGFPGTTEFFYDQQGRQSAFIYLGDRATFTYGTDNRLIDIVFAYTTAIDVTGEQTVFTYDDAQRQVRARLSNLTTVNGQYIPRDQIKTSIYTFDDQRLLPTSLSEFTPTSQGSSTNEYTSTNGNIIRSVYKPASRGNSLAFDYVYDNRPNPFYGLIGPGITDMRRFSRNNVEKIITTSNLGTPDQRQSETAIQYEYNTQGLPTRAVSDNSEVRFEYESY